MSIKNVVLMAAAALALARVGVDAACADATDCGTCVLQPDCYYDTDGTCVDQQPPYTSCDSPTMMNKARFPGMTDATAICTALKDRETIVSARNIANTACAASTADCGTCTKTDNCMWNVYEEGGGKSHCGFDATAFSDGMTKKPNGYVCTTAAECVDGLVCATRNNGNTTKFCSDVIAVAVRESKETPSTTTPGRRLLCSLPQAPSAMIKETAKCESGTSTPSTECKDLECNKCLQKPECYLTMNDGKCVDTVATSECYGPSTAVNKDRYPSGFADDASTTASCNTIHATRAYNEKMKVMSDECSRLKFCDSCMTASMCMFEIYVNPNDSEDVYCKLDYAAFSKANPPVDAANLGVAPVPPGVNCPISATAMPRMPTSTLQDDSTCPAAGSGSAKDPVPYTDKTEKTVIPDPIGDPGTAASMTPVAIVSALATALLLLF